MAGVKSTPNSATLMLHTWKTTPKQKRSKRLIWGKKYKPYDVCVFVGLFRLLQGDNASPCDFPFQTVFWFTIHVVLYIWYLFATRAGCSTFLYVAVRDEQRFKNINWPSWIFVRFYFAQLCMRFWVFLSSPIAWCSGMHLFLAMFDFINFLFWHIFILFMSPSGLTVASVNLKPLVPGHVLVIPRRVVPLLEGLTDLEFDDLIQTVRMVQSIVEGHYGAAASNIGIQDGRDAGQSVANVHVHILPRR